MSTHNHGEKEGGSKSEDPIDFTKVIAVGVASLAIFAVSTWWAYIILKREVAQVHDSVGEARPPAYIGKDEIGIVDQVPFTEDKRLDVWRKKMDTRLSGPPGWVDRAKGVAHIPIDQAMDKVAGGAMPAGAPK